MTKNEAMRLARMFEVLQSLGFTQSEAEKLRRISMTLHRWHELECGDSNDYASWAIERDGDEPDSKPYMVRHSHTGGKSTRYPIADRETGARKRLDAIIERINKPYRFPFHQLSAYVQGDPRGAALYILRPGDIPEGQTADACYSRGICVY